MPWIIGTSQAWLWMAVSTRLSATCVVKVGPPKSVQFTRMAMWCREREFLAMRRPLVVGEGESERALADVLRDEVRGVVDLLVEDFVVRDVVEENVREGMVADLHAQVVNAADFIPGERPLAEFEAGLTDGRIGRMLPRATRGRRKKFPGCRTGAASARRCRRGIAGRHRRCRRGRRGRHHAIARCAACRRWAASGRGRCDFQGNGKKAVRRRRRWRGGATSVSWSKILWKDGCENKSTTKEQNGEPATILRFGSQKYCQRLMRKRHFWRSPCEYKALSLGTCTMSMKTAPNRSQGAAAGEVVGVAGDPQLCVPVGAGDGKDDAAGAFGEVVAAGGGEHVVADVAEVTVEVFRMADVEGDRAGERDGQRGEARVRRDGADAQPERVAGGDLAGGIGLAAALRGLVDEGHQRIARGFGLHGHVFFGQRVMAGGEEVVNVGAPRVRRVPDPRRPAGRARGESTKTNAGGFRSAGAVGWCLVSRRNKKMLPGQTSINCVDCIVIW